MEITFNKREPGEGLTGTLVLKDEGGTVVFMSTSASSHSLKVTSNEDTTQEPGIIRAVCSIPADLLNEGRYSVSIYVGRGINQPYASADDCLAFDVHDTGEQRGLYTGAWPGVIRPKLDWNIQRIEAL